MRMMEACVVGGGPVGLFAALCLNERGVPVQVVDAEWERPVRSYACGLHPESLRLLGAVGVLPAIEEMAHRVDRLVVWRGPERALVVDFGQLAGPYRYVLGVRQSGLQEVLAEALARRGIFPSLHQEVTEIVLRDDQVTLAAVPQRRARPAAPGVHAAPAERETVVRAADYVIGADGYHSVCRQALGAELVNLQNSEAFAMFEFEADLASLEHEVHVILDEAAVSAFWPLGPRQGRWSFQLWERLDETPSIDLLRELVRARAPWVRSRPEQLGWATTVYFERLLSSRFGAGRLWLAGESAHVTCPIGFQSLNRGFVEASELAAAMASALHGEAGAARSFERFERAQQAEWRRLLGIELGVISQGPLSPAEGARLVPCLPASGADLDALLRQLDLRLA